MSERSTRGSEQITTIIGGIEFETPRRVENPKQRKREQIEESAEGGYKRGFLALWNELQKRHNYIDLNSTDVLSFDCNKWELIETDGRIILQLKNAENPVTNGTETEGGKADE